MTRSRNTILTFLALLAVTATVACAPPEETAAPAPESTAPSEPASADLTLTPLGDSPQYADAALTLNGYDLDAGVFDFAVAGYELGTQTADAADKGIANSGEGQHIHLIIDNGPYSAHYDDDAEADLEDGNHVVLAFLSRSYHESVKNPAAAVLTEIAVGELVDESANAFNPAAPHLFYSRPKGTYVGGDIENLMLDFYLVNADLASDGYRVRVTINGQEFLIDDWRPYVIRGLDPGEATVELQLIDADGNPVPGPFNHVTRTVMLEAEAPAA